MVQGPGCRVKVAGFRLQVLHTVSLVHQAWGAGFMVWVFVRWVWQGLLHWVVCWFVPVPFGDEAVSVAAEFAAEHFPDAMLQRVRFKCSGAGLGVPVAAQCSCGQGVE